MLSLVQATKLLATVYGVSKDTMGKRRRALADAGVIPATVGRNHPEATPNRAALLVLSLAIPDPERVAEIADLQRYKNLPGDWDQTSVGDVLAASLAGLRDNPDMGLDMTMVVSTQGPLSAHFTGPQGVIMSFTDPNPTGGFIHHSASLSLMPLALFCEKARGVQPPFRVVR